MPNSLLVRVVFGVIVLATFGAFFAAQRLKRAPAFVERVYYRGYISPTCGCEKSRVALRFSLRRRGRVSVAIVTAAGDPVRTLVDDRELRRGMHRLAWNGRADDGALAPDGVYHLRVTLHDEGRTYTAPRRLTLDTKPPRPRILAVTPGVIVPGAPGVAGRARIRYRGPSNPHPLVRVYRTDVGRPRLVTTFPAPRFRKTARWDGTIDGRPAPDGVYAIAITVFDRAGNAGSAPLRLPPQRGEATTGVSVRYLTVSGPLEPVAAGSVARFEVGPIARRFRWSLGPVRAGRPLARGTGGGRSLSLRVPPDASTGLYLLRVQAAGHRAAAPLAVQGRRRGSVLVVLPAIDWQGLNLVDDDGDGFPDVLTAGDSASYRRPFAHGRLPAGLADEVDPLLRFLAREHARYEITTDLALAQGRGPRLEGRPGVLFAGNERWLTDRLDLALRDYVEAGGRVASFGTDSFRRRVSVGAASLEAPTAPERVNVFGEETSELRIELAPMAVSGPDRLGLFARTDGLVGLFDRFEQSQRLVAGARVLSSAGRDPQHPAFVAYALGKGLVIRAGAPAWAASLARDSELSDVTRRIWALLSR